MLETDYVDGVILGGCWNTVCEMGQDSMSGTLGYLVGEAATTYDRVACCDPADWHDLVDRLRFIVLHLGCAKWMLETRWI